MKPIETWLSEGELAQIYTAGYWNDIERERTKHWWIADGKYERCLSYLETSGLLDEYRAAEGLITGSGKSGLTVLDLAAGTGWASALLTKLPCVSSVLAVEISKHRLAELFEHSFKMLAGDGDKVTRCLGSFYDLKVPSGAADIVFMSQAFHHADRPFDLFQQCDRALKPGGMALLVGEHWISTTKLIARALLFAARSRRLPESFQDIFPTDPILGDHYYRRSDYYFLLGAFGYDVSHVKTGGSKCIYVARKPGAGR
ncbi:MAG: class I SAM-dependent methyltransferase [Chthoniobacterales bacterium]|nr:class I SAM-dependent methyltransferase [Chthoniobacterales bacterium]